MSFFKFWVTQRLAFRTMITLACALPHPCIWNTSTHDNPDFCYFSRFDEVKFPSQDIKEQQSEQPQRQSSSTPSNRDWPRSLTKVCWLWRRRIWGDLAATGYRCPELDWQSRTIRLNFPQIQCCNSYRSACWMDQVFDLRPFTQVRSKRHNGSWCLASKGCDLAWTANNPKCTLNNITCWWSRKKLTNRLVEKQIDFWGLKRMLKVCRTRCSWILRHCIRKSAEEWLSEIPFDLPCQMWPCKGSKKKRLRSWNIIPPDVIEYFYVLQC